MVDLQTEDHHLTPHRGIPALLCGGIHGDKDTGVLGRWVGEVGVMLLRLRVLGSLCLLVVGSLACGAVVLGMPVYCRGLLRLRLPRRTS